MNDAFGWSILIVIVTCYASTLGLLGRQLARIEKLLREKSP